jgi:hypothetical protein
MLAEVPSLYPGVLQRLLNTAGLVKKVRGFVTRMPDCKSMQRE